MHFVVKNYLELWSTVIHTAKRWSKFAKIWVNIPRVQFVFNTWMWLAMVTNHCRDMNMKHIISIIIISIICMIWLKVSTVNQFINKKPNFLQVNKSHASSMCHLFHTALDFHQEVVLQLHTLCILLKHISNQNGSNSNSDYSGLQVIYRNLSWPAVSQICSLTDFPPTFTTLLPNSTPMVWLESFLTEIQNQKHVLFLMIFSFLFEGVWNIMHSNLAALV